MDEFDIFNKFSPHARKVLVSAQKFAKSLRQALSSEHILMALATTPQTLSYGLLKEHFIGPDQIRLILASRDELPVFGAGIAPETKKILELAIQAAGEFGHNQIDTEHLLLAIVSSKNIASDVISRLGTAPGAIKDHILNFFDDLKEFDQMGEPKFPLSEKEPFSDDEFLPSGAGFEEMPSPPAAKTIGSFTTDLTALAEEGKIDPVIGRQREIERVIQILCRRQKNNPVLVGEPGVGKTAIVEGLVQKIVRNDVPSKIAGKRVIMLDLALLVAGTMYRGQFEERIKKVLDELIKKENTILFIDEIHTIVGAGSAEGSLDLANILKPSLAKGKLRLIGATTFDEYRKFIEKDAALERRMQKVTVAEPTAEETVAILKGIRANYEKHHGVKISDEAIAAAVELSQRYINDRFLPDKAIDLVDEAAAAWQIGHDRKDINNFYQLKQKLAEVIREKEKEVAAENFPKAAQLRSLELRLKEKISQAQKQESRQTQPLVSEISREDIARTLSLWTNVPAETLKKEEKEKFLRLDANLKKHIIGQDEAVSEIASAIKRSKTGIADPNRPIGSFIFLGPTGVGKTELARVLAQELFGSREALIKIDMSEFMERHNLSRLLGAPPGYVGYEDAGKLTEKVRQRPYSIVLFDEIEKAHPEVLNILLQILEDGEVTDAKGRKINFRHTIIIMTSNIGMAELNQQAAIGFAARRRRGSFLEQYDKMKDELVKRLKNQLKPEFLNRIDKIVVFKPLSKEQIHKITQLQLDNLVRRLTQEGIKLKIEPSVDALIARAGFDSHYGARPIRRAIADLIEGPLSEKILSSEIGKNDTLKIAARRGKISFQRLKKTAKVV